MHFHAGANFAYLWQIRMNPLIWEKPLSTKKEYLKYCEKDYGSFPIVVFRLIWAMFLEKKEKSFRKYLEKQYPDHKQILLRLLDMAGGKDPLGYDSEWSDLLVELRTRWNIRDDNSRYEDVLFATIYNRYQSCYTYAEFIFLFKSLWYFKKHPQSDWERHLFLSYIRHKNLFFGQITHSEMVQGLANFTKYYGRAMKNLYLNFSNFVTRI